MCFYEQNVFRDCHCFKWGRFRQHCAKEYRTGETCGMKLIYEAVPKPGKCAICNRIDVATRKLFASKEKVGRWLAEGRNPVSTENEQENIQLYQNEIKELNAQKAAKLRSIG
ncbi:hypothetical protein Dda_3927 [Drechslerella dactyloides]|uniref:Uncharacterized protein n=1 Tax=Drechslerella dactyloides TaxID=74499 RepID=A0AAD6J0B5_DREDA|nr:hypothetical protein Dda_3927 [Drechslerella dactyloides]